VACDLFSAFVLHAEHLTQSQLSSDLKQSEHLVFMQLQSVASSQMVSMGLLQEPQSFWDAF
jgi:hypothetical protein